MKTLILNGSPRRGNTSALLKKMVERADGDIITIDTFGAKIAPCIHCEKCADNRCLISDDMEKIYEANQTADNIILASPVYFGGLTPPLMSVMSRFQCFFHDFAVAPKTGKPKKGIIILTEGSSGAESHAEKDARLLLKMMNTEVIDVIWARDTDKLPAADNAEAMSRADAAAKVLFKK